MTAEMTFVQGHRCFAWLRERWLHILGLQYTAYFSQSVFLRNYSMLKKNAGEFCAIFYCYFFKK